MGRRPKKQAADQRKRQPRRKTKQTAKRSAVSPNAPMSGFVPRQRQSMLTPDLQREICGKIAAGDTMKDAALTSGVALSTVYEWMNKRPEFSESVRQAEGTRRRVYRALIRKAGIGDGKKPGDWRATAHLGACTDPEAFVPQVRVHITGELDGALDRLKEAFASNPEAYALALHAIAGGESEEPAGPDGDGPGGGGSPQSGS